MELHVCLDRILVQHWPSKSEILQKGPRRQKIVNVSKVDINDHNMSTVDKVDKNRHGWLEHVQSGQKCPNMSKVDEMGKNCHNMSKVDKIDKNGQNMFKMDKKCYSMSKVDKNS